MRTLLFALAVVAGIFIAGWIVITLLKIALGLLLYLFIGALIVGAVVFLFGKIRDATSRRR